MHHINTETSKTHENKTKNGLQNVHAKETTNPNTKSKSKSKSKPKQYQSTKVTENLRKMIRKYSDLHLVNLSFVNSTQQSLYHIVTAYDMSDVFDLLVEIDNDIAKYKDIYGQVLFFVIVLVLILILNTLQIVWLINQSFW